MNLFTLPVLLAVVALAFAAPENYGKHGQFMTTTLANDQPEFDCSDKDNGGYVIGCSQNYFECWNGVATKASCPEGMMFNQDNGQCDFNTNIFECTGVRTTAPLAAETTTLPPVNFDCSKLTDGDYPFSSDCEASYVSCAGGLAVARTCPDQLQFDPQNRICDRIEHIEACGGSPTTVAPTMEIEFNCPSPNGNFGITSQLCSAVYYVCNDNVASIAVCDDPMIWDDVNKVCALPKDTQDCSFDCAGKADAAYSQGCSQYYWWCWQERATKQACPEGMAFDGQNGLCDFQNNVFECTGVAATTVQADQPSTMAPVDFDCSGLQDGQYSFNDGKRCQQKFVACVGGLAWEMECPEGLLFDADQLWCDRQENIVACGGTAAPITTTISSIQTTSISNDFPQDNSYGYGYQSTTPRAVPKIAHRQKLHKTTKAPITTTIANDVPQNNGYGYDTTTLADVPTTHRSYGQRKMTTLRDIPTTKAYGYHQRKLTTTLADIPTTKAYGGYNHQRKLTTTLADIPTTKSYGGYNQKRTTTTLATTTMEDEPITSTLGYESDDYAQSINLDTTPLADFPLITPRRRMHKTTTIANDFPQENGYGSIETTTLADIPTTKSYGGYSQQRKLTTVRDVPTTKAYGYQQRKLTTTLADIPTTKAYGGYSQQRKLTTTLADIPTTKAYGGYGQQRKLTTTLADIPTTQAYGSYGQQRKLTTTLADIPTTKAYGYQQRKLTTTLADIPTTQAYGSYGQQRKLTTTLADVPVTRSYGGYQTTTPLADVPTTKSYGRVHKMTTTTVAADVPIEENSYGSIETTTPLADVPTTRGYGQQRKLTTPRPRILHRKIQTTTAAVPEIEQGY